MTGAILFITMPGMSRLTQSNWFLVIRDSSLGLPLSSLVGIEVVFASCFIMFFLIGTIFILENYQFGLLLFLPIYSRQRVESLFADWIRKNWPLHLYSPYRFLWELNGACYWRQFLLLLSHHYLLLIKLFVKIFGCHKNYGKYHIIDK